jgi:radical SAM protein with 4Fe4S-binding SPASM domain
MSACTIPILSYGEFSRRVHTRSSWESDGRVPLNAGIEPTGRCNLRCAHCYVPRGNAGRELTAGEWKRILDQAAGLGTFYLLITGGEPFLRDDLPEIYIHAKRLGMLVTLFTNATLLAPHDVEMLAEYPPFSMEVTLYGAGPETYERVTGSAEAYGNAVRGIRLLKEAGLPVGLKTMTLKQNHRDLRAMQAFAAELDLPFRFDGCIHPAVDGRRDPVSSRLEPADVVALDLGEPGRLREMAELHERFRGTPDPSRVFNCGAGRNSFHVSPSGEYLPCGSLHAFGADSRRTSLREFWHGHLEKVLSLEPERDSRCRRCSLQVLCGQCPAWSLMENGNLEDPVDFLCRVTTSRAEALGLEERPPVEENAL